MADLSAETKIAGTKARLHVTKLSGSSFQVVPGMEPFLRNRDFRVSG